jgi:CheY-like chemotaxis protein
MLRRCFASSSGASFASAVSRWILPSRRTAPFQRINDAAGALSLILILSDINMPGITGLELLPKAKAARPDVPVIMITAYGDTDTRRKALEGGAEALLTKPIDFVALRSEIDNRVAGAGAEVR